jgi:hypothetical protein
MGTPIRKNLRAIAGESVMTLQQAQFDETRIVKELFALISSAAAPDWFTEEELALYLRLVNKDGKPVTAGIKKWVSRDPKDNPLPRRYIGDKPRFYRPEVIRWTEEETRRQQNKTGHKGNERNEVVTSLSTESNNPAALTAAAS